MTKRVPARRRYRVTDYTNPGAGQYLGNVLGANWDDAFANANRIWPDRTLQVSSLGAR